MNTDTLVDRVYETLKLKILRQELTYGQRLNLTALAKELNVSNTPLREAISRLEKVGLVTIVPYRGPYVKGLSALEVAEAYDVRIVLEALAVRELVASSLTAATLTQLKDIHRQYQQALKNSDHHQVRIVDFTFHETIAQASSNDTLIGFLQTLSDWVQVFMQSRLPPPRPATILIGEHQRILDALSTRDQIKAGEAMEQHLIAGKADLMQNLAGQHPEQTSGQGTSYPEIWQDGAGYTQYPDEQIIP